MTDKFEELQRYIKNKTDEENNREIADFEGYSPIEMRLILHDTFGKESPIQLNELSEADYKSIPILNQIKFLTNLIMEHGELKLTKTDCLRPEIIKEIYRQGFIKDDAIEAGITKLSREGDVLSIIITKYLLYFSGITKKRHNKLSITKKGEKLLSDNYKLLKKIFSIYCLKLDISCFDLYMNNGIGQLGVGFTLILLSKYGKNKHPDKFYSDKYFKAFPFLLEKDYEAKEKVTANAYSLRTFDRFLDFFGLIEIEKQKKWGSVKYISKTQLFDKLIKCMPHRRRKPHDYFLCVN